MRRAAAELPGVVTRIEQENLRDVQTVAEKRSSGGYSLASLARMDHPYARRHGIPLEEPGIINVQSGVFRRSWTSFGPYSVNDKLISRVANLDPKANYLEQRWGHPKTRMFARPINILIASTCRPRIQARRRLLYTLLFRG